MEKIIFATLYRHQAIVKLLFELQPIKKLILFVDKEKTKMQEESISFIKEITKTTEIKLEFVEIDNVFDFEELVQSYHDQIRKYKKEELYFDVSHSKRTLGYALITYLSIYFPENLKTLYAYSSSDNKIMEVPIFKAEEFPEKEIKALEYIQEHSMFFHKDLGDYLSVSKQYAGRMIDELIKKQLISKDSKYELTLKGKVYLIAKK